MNPLLPKKETFIVIKDSDLDTFVEKVYGHEKEFVCDQELTNDAYYHFSVRKEELNPLDHERIDDFKAFGGGVYLYQTLLADMCNNGLIEEGEYLIKVD